MFFFPLQTPSLAQTSGSPSTQTKQGTKSKASKTPSAGTKAGGNPSKIPQGGSYDVLLVGSSSINGYLGRIIEDEITKSGLRVKRFAKSATGFARPDFFDWDAQIREFGSLSNVKGVILYAGGNDTQSLWVRPADRAQMGVTDADPWIQWRDATRWRASYRARVRAVVDQFCAAGAQKVIVLVPAEGEREGWVEKMKRVQEEQLLSTQSSACGVSVDTRGAPQPSKVPFTVDGVHHTREGARSIWRFIQTRLKSQLGLS